MPAIPVHETDAQAVRAEGPVRWVGHGLEVCEKGQAAGEVGEQGGRDGGEARVVEGGGEGVGGEAGGEGEGVEGADAAAEGFVAGGAGDGVPGYEEGVVGG